MEDMQPFCHRAVYAKIIPWLTLPPVSVNATSRQ